MKSSGVRWILKTMAMLLMVVFGARAAMAETLMMPDRKGLMGTAVVVWGITTQANGTSYTMDFGDSSVLVNGTVGDRSFIYFSHVYSTSATFTAKLTVGL